MKLSNLKKRQKKRLIITFACYIIIGVTVLTIFCTSLYSEKNKAQQGWESYLTDDTETAQTVDALSKDATIVHVGTYIDNLRELNLKNSEYRVEFLVWFNWEGDADLDPAHNFRIYKGEEKHKTIVKEVHEGGRHYQLVRMDALVSKNFDTKRFPLESHQLRFYIESAYPVQDVVYVADHEGSGINRNITLTGYEFRRHDIAAVNYRYDENHGDPSITGDVYTSELVTAFEINRSSLGLYFKCFIALAGTLTWVLITLFICTYHRIDPLGMVPAALFGTVSNIMIGANLLPDALELGLLEYVNLWGVMCVLGGALAIININWVRKHAEDDEDKVFTQMFGRALFFTVFVFAFGGQVLLPICAYMW